MKHGGTLDGAIEEVCDEKGDGEIDQQQIAPLGNATQKGVTE